MQCLESSVQGHPVTLKKNTMHAVACFFLHLVLVEPYESTCLEQLPQSPPISLVYSHKQGLSERSDQFPCMRRLAEPILAWEGTPIVTPGTHNLPDVKQVIHVPSAEVPRVVGCRNLHRLAILCSPLPHGLQVSNADTDICPKGLTWRLASGHWHLKLLAAIFKLSYCTISASFWNSDAQGNFCTP